MAEVDTEGFLTELPPIPDDEFCVYGTVHAHPQHADALEAVYRETTKLARDEPGTLYYCLARDEHDRSMFHMIESYTGRKAFEVHNEQPIIQKLVTEDGYIRGVKATFVRGIGPWGIKK